MGGFNSDKKEGYFAVADDSRWLAVAGPDGDVFIADTTTGKIIHKYHQQRSEAAESASDAETSAISVHPIRDKGYMIRDKENRFDFFKLLRPSLARPFVWRPPLAPDILLKAKLPSDAFVLAVVASLDRKWFLVCREDGVASLYAAGRECLVKTFVSDGGRVRGGGFSPDGQTLVTCGMKGKSFVWHIASGELLAELKDDSGFVSDSYFSPKGNYVVSVHGSSNLRSASFSPDGSKAVVVCDDGKAWIFDTPAFISMNELIEWVSKRLENQAQWLEVSIKGGKRND